MKITLSKAKWEEMGKKAGWVKADCQECISDKSTTIPTEVGEVEKQECKRCRGNKFFYQQKIKDLGTLDNFEHLTVCPSCKGKGYTTKKDREEERYSYLHSIGVVPHEEE